MKALDGFSLVELIVALAIVAMIGAIGIGRLRQNQEQAIETLAEGINRLTRLAYVRALITGKLHRVYFAVAGDARRIQVEEEAGRDSKGGRTFTPISVSMAPTSVELDSRFVIDNFVICGIDEAQSSRLQDVWLYVFPSGLAQDIVINVRDTLSDLRRGLVLNPFSVRFTVYDAYQSA